MGGGGLVGVSDNLCLPQEGVVFLDFWEFHGVLGFGNYGEVEMRSKADDADDAKEAIGEGFFRGSRVRIARAAMSCRPRPVKFSTNSVCRSQNGSLMVQSRRKVSFSGIPNS